MAPKSKSNAAIKTIEFEKYFPEITENGEKIRSERGYLKPILREGGLTEDILVNGNLEDLQRFYKERESQLNQREREYMEARIESAEKIRALRHKAEDRIAEGKLPPQPKLDNKDGFIGFSGLRGDDVQTSRNGCWSYSLAIQLKARGVDLPQEQIRGWRPDQSRNPLTAKQKAGPGYRQKVYSMIERTNADTPNTIYNTADLVHEVLPNTAVIQFSLRPVNTDALFLDGNPLTPAEKRVVLSQVAADMKQSLRETIERAIKQDHSPLSMVKRGHFVTITGIDKDGNTIRLEDSQQALAKDRTKTVKLDDLVSFVMNSNSPIDFTWLRDLPKPEYEKRGDEVEKLFPPDPKFAVKNGNGEMTVPKLVTVDEDGNLKVDIPEEVNASRIGSPGDGQMLGEGYYEAHDANIESLEKKLGGKSLDNFGFGKHIEIGSTEVYLPKKMRFLHDPELQKNIDAHALEARHEQTYRNVQGPLTQALQNLKSLNDPKQEENGKIAPLPEGVDGKKLLDDVREYEKIFKWLKYSAKHNGTDVTDQKDTLQKARQFGEFLCSKQGDQTMYQILMSQMPPQSTVKFAKGVHGLNDALNLDINFDALGPKELTDVNELDYRVKVRTEWEKLTAGGEQSKDPSALAPLLMLQSAYQTYYPRNMRAPEIDEADNAYQRMYGKVENSRALAELTAQIGDSKLTEKFASPEKLFAAYCEKVNRFGLEPQRASAPKQPEITVKQPEITVKQPEIAAKQPAAARRKSKTTEQMLTQGNPIVKDYIEELQRKVQAMPKPALSPAQLDAQKSIAMKILAARIGINARAGSVGGSALKKNREHDKEVNAFRSLEQSEAMEWFFRKTAPEKLRSLLLTGHGGELERSIQTYIAGFDKLPAGVPERLMPTAKQRCEALQAKLKDAPDAQRTEELYKELLAARDSVGAKRGGAGLENKLSAEGVAGARALIERDSAMHSALSAASRDPKCSAMALRGHGGALVDALKKSAGRDKPAAESTGSAQKEKTTTDLIQGELVL